MLHVGAVHEVPGQELSLRLKPVTDSIKKRSWEQLQAVMTPAQKKRWEEREAAMDSLRKANAARGREGKGSSQARQTAGARRRTVRGPALSGVRRAARRPIPRRRLV